MMMLVHAPKLLLSSVYSFFLSNEKLPLVSLTYSLSQFTAYVYPEQDWAGY